MCGRLRRRACRGLRVERFMGPIAYSLCQKPIIGVVLFITSLCAFPPLFMGEPITLTTAGSKVSKAFSVPVEKKYPLVVSFEFQSIETRLSDQIIGDRHSRDCDGEVRFEDIPEIRRAGLGQPIPFKVVVRSASNRQVVVDRTYNSLCITSHNGNEKTRTIGWLELPRGDYTVDVTNLQAQTGLDGVMTQISLYAGQGK